MIDRVPRRLAYLELVERGLIVVEGQHDFTVGGALDDLIVTALKLRQ